MVLLSALILGAATSFGPGTVDDFAQSLADATQKDAIVAISRGVQLPKFSYDASSADAMSMSVRKGASLTMAPGSDPIFSDHTYVSEHFQPIAPNLPGPPSMANKLPDDVIKNGKVTLATHGATPISIEAIAAAKWSRPVEVDYLMRDLAASMSVKDMPERTFLSALAKAAGGNLTLNDKGFKIAYDAEQLRTRIISTLKQVKAGPVKQEIDIKREFYAAVVNILPQDVLVSIFQTPEGAPRLDVLPNTDLATLSIEYIRALQEWRASQLVADPGAAPALRRPGRANRGGTGNVPDDILSRVDTRATVHLRLNASGLIVLSVPVIQGRTSQYIDL